MLGTITRLGTSTRDRFVDGGSAEEVAVLAMVVSVQLLWEGPILVLARAKNSPLVIWCEGMPNACPALTWASIILCRVAPCCSIRTWSSL